MSFELYLKTPNAISTGKLYTSKIDVPFSNEKRTIRVYVPDELDKTKKYKVLVMADGQNLVDKYTTAFGEWNFDEVLEKMYLQGYEKIILVGIDSPNDDLKRMIELAPNIKTSRFEGHSFIGVADRYINFIFDELLPYVSKYFPISLNKLDIGIGGSSMGGLMSFYAAIIRGNDFKFCLSFSPAFLLYSNKKLIEMINDININNLPKIFFFVGGEGFEASFVDKTLKMYNSLKKLGMNKDNLRLIYDSDKIHHESSWNAYLEESLSFFLNK